VIRAKAPDMGKERRSASYTAKGDERKREEVEMAARL
jgi:hypothetical protein